MFHPVVEEGQEIHLSLRKALVHVLHGILCMFIGTVLFVASVILFTGWYTGQVGWALSGFGSPLAFLGGLACNAFGVLACASTVILWWRRRRLILGKESLQWVIGPDEVLTQVPFDNIRDVRAVEHVDESN